MNITTIDTNATENNKDNGFRAYKNDYFSLWTESESIINTPEYQRDPYFIIYDSQDIETSRRKSKISFYRPVYIGLENTYKLNKIERSELYHALKTTYANSRYDFNIDKSIFSTLALQSGIKALTVLDIPNYRLLD